MEPYTPLYYIPNDTIYFNINKLSYKTYKEKVITDYKCMCENDDLTEEETCKCGPSHEILFNFKLFNFDEFTKNENILTKIRKRLNEELKKYENFTFVSKFVRIEIGYIIHHSPEGKEKAEKAYYKERDRYR